MFLTYSYYGSSVKLLDLYLTGLVSLISLKMQKKPIILYSYGKKKKKIVTRLNEDYLFKCENTLIETDFLIFPFCH